MDGYSCKEVGVCWPRAVWLFRFFCGIAILFGGGLGGASENDKYKNMPAAWGAPTQRWFENSECPLISGKYYFETNERYVSVEHGSPDERGAQRFSARMLFSHPRAKRWDVKKLDIPLLPESFYVEIIQSSVNKFSVHQPLADGTGMRVQYFDQTFGDFFCKAGYINIRPYELRQSGLYIKREDKFTLTEGGELIYGEKVENQRSEMLIFSSSSVVHYWYRFQPKILHSN